jgi:hypothetical protein
MGEIFILPRKKSRKLCTFCHRFKKDVLFHQCHVYRARAGGRSHHSRQTIKHFVMTSFHSFREPRSRTEGVRPQHKTSGVCRKAKIRLVYSSTKTSNHFISGEVPSSEPFPWETISYDEKVKNVRIDKKNKKSSKEIKKTKKTDNMRINIKT